MRVISGSAKSRKLKSPPPQTRPITDRAKEALFNILGPRVIDASVLDLYAGAGSIGIEALSRGARFATFVELDPDVLRVLRENLQQTGLAGRARVVRENVFRFVARPPAELYDLIYVAPPQYKDLWAETMDRLNKHSFLALGGLVIVQIHPKEYRDLELARYEIYDRRKYGSVLLCFYRAKGA